MNKYRNSQTSMRKMFQEERINRIRNAGGLLAPLLAQRTSHPEDLGAVKKHRAGITGDKIDEIEQGTAIADLQPEAWFTVDRAARLCAAIEEAIVHNHIGVMAELIDESVEVSKSMMMLEGQMGRDSDFGKATAAVSAVSQYEKTLLDSRKEIEKTEETKNLWGGVIEKYAFSPSHNAVIAVVDIEQEKHALRTDEMDETPKIGSRIHAHRKADKIEIENLGRPSREHGRERIA